MGVGSSQQLSKRKLTDLMDATLFSAKEISEWYEQFHKDYPEGVIDQQAFTKMYQNMFPGGNATPFAELLFRAYDADGNGVINFPEFITTLNVSAKGTEEEKLKWSFKLYDLDGNGTLSRKEAFKVMQAINQLHGKDGEKECLEKAQETVDKLFTYMDKNHNDEITEVEFLIRAKNSEEIMKILAET